MRIATLPRVVGKPLDNRRQADRVGHVDRAAAGLRQQVGIAKFIAMPRPIVPAPTIHSLRTGRSATSGGRPGIFADRGPAKKRY